MNFEAFNEKLRGQSLPVVIDVWAPWCGPCRSIEPALRQLGQEYAGRVDVWRINADEDPELVRSLRIFGIPTLLVYRGEQEVMRTTGAQPAASLERLFEAALSGEPSASAGLPLRERLLRLAIGLALALAVYFTGGSLFWYLPAGLVLFSAVYDRCPIWQALAPRVSRWLSGKPESEKAQG